jgi:hypothetical protein
VLDWTIHSPDGTAREYGGLHRALDQPQFGLWINVIDDDVRFKLGSFRNWARSARHVASREKPMLSVSCEIGKPLVAVCELS